MATTTPPTANMNRNLAVSTLLPVYRAAAKPDVNVTPAVTSASSPMVLAISHRSLHESQQDEVEGMSRADLTWQQDQEVGIEGIVAHWSADERNKR